MYKLLYSQKANDLFGHNIALNTNGEQVAYTAMYNEEIYGPWQAHYLWDDAQEVGILDRIISYNTKNNFKMRNEKDPYRYWR